jgi:hypothetical protein
MPTLPKRLLPVKLSSVKRALYALIALRNPAAALNLSGFSSVFRGSASTSNALGAKDIPTTTTSAFVDGESPLTHTGCCCLHRPEPLSGNCWIHHQYRPAAPLAIDTVNGQYYAVPLPVDLTTHQCTECLPSCF